METDQKQEDKGPDYIGPHQVFALQREEYTTPTGGEVVRVLFENASPRIMSMRLYQMLATKAPIDLTTLRDKKFDLLLENATALFMEYNPTALEIDVFINQQLVPRLQSVFAKGAFLSVNNQAYGNPKVKEWVPGTADFSQYLTLLECDMICKKFVDEENNENPTAQKTIDK